MLFLSLLAAAAAVAARVAPPPVVQWGPCEDDFGAPLPVDCGRVDVPLDYTNPGGEALTLQLLRARAIKQPAKESILLNFGGPGGLGRSSLAKMAPLLHMFSGGHHNLIAFDPRGTGSTIPFTHLETDLEKILYAIDALSPPRVDEIEQLGHYWARGKVMTQQVERRQNKTGELIGTAFTARDMMRVAEAIGEDGLLRYWGFSYGTTLGATLVSMFPDKVDKVILDGVQNPHEYYWAYEDTEEWSDSDEEFSHIFQHCVQNPSVCPLARPGLSAADMEQSVWDLLERLKYHPVTIGDWVVDRHRLTNLIIESLYAYTSWPKLTTVLGMLLRNTQDENIPFLTEALHLSAGGRLALMAEDDLALDQALVGIHCLDRAARAGSLEALMPTLRKLRDVSRVLDGITTGRTVPCAQWKLEPRERYKGDFQVETRRPVLLVGNTLDGLTPLQSAWNVSSGLKGSTVLQVDGYGHASLGLPSACSLRAIRKYWADGIMPQNGTVCKVDAPPFSNVTWVDVLNGMEEKDVQESGELRRRGEGDDIEEALWHFQKMGMKTLRGRM